MSEKKLIAVIGATGAQGGGLARAILNDRNGGFAVRAITRNPDSDKGKALAAAGAQVVAADLDDPASLREAFAGAHGAFCVTNFWEHFSPEKEVVQAGHMADAAKATGVKHVVWSTLEDIRKWVPLSDDRMPTLQGKYKVPHFDGKGEADALFAASGVPTTYFAASFYWDNFIHFGMGPRRVDGNVVLVLPMGEAKLPGIGAEDIGRCAYGVFRGGAEYAGKEVGVAGAVLTGKEMAAALTRALGVDVSYYAIPFDDYRALGFPGADDLGNMFQHHHDFNDDFITRRDVALSRKLNPELQDFDQWLAAHKHLIQIQE